MPQRYHSNATTNVHLRSEIHRVKNPIQHFVYNMGFQKNRMVSENHVIRLQLKAPDQRLSPML